MVLEHSLLVEHLVSEHDFGYTILQYVECDWYPLAVCKGPICFHLADGLLYAPVSKLEADLVLGI